jgi:hypothetical protein
MQRNYSICSINFGVTVSNLSYNDIKKYKTREWTEEADIAFALVTLHRCSTRGEGASFLCTYEEVGR